MLILNEFGLKLTLVLYWAHYDPTSWLVERYWFKIYTAATKTKKEDIERIIPTVDGFIQHIKRVYLQAQTWIEDKINSLELGWPLKNE